MNTVPTDIFSLAEKRLDWIGQRQSVLAQNIANANTPGYVARDVTPFSEILAGTTQQTGGVAVTAARSLDGNAVVLDEQLEKVAETDTAHQLAANLYKKYVSLFKTAIGRN